MVPDGYVDHKTGNRFIDCAHVSLMESIGDLRERCVEGAGKETVVPRFNAVVGDLLAHFGHEEIIIRASGFREWEAHASQHAIIGTQIARLVDYVRECEVSADFLCTVAGTLDLMLSQHEMKHDREYAGLLRTAPVPSAGEELVPWTAEFETGIESVDAQHRDLTGLLNRMHRLAAAERPMDEALELFDAMHDHAQSHFAMEEGVVRGRAPGRFHQHQLHHRTLLAQLQDVRARVADGRLSLAVAAGDFLRFWLMDHIVGCDQPILQGSTSGAA